MPVPVGSYSGPSCWDKMKMGFTYGFCIGLVTGTLLGGFTVFRHSLRGRELVTTMGKYMMNGGGTFGTFMAIGQGTRC